MKTIWIVLLIIIGIIVIILGFIGFTVWQGLQLLEYTDENGEFMTNVKALQEGDCSKADDVEQGLRDAKRDVNGACRNPLMSYVAKKVSGDDICGEIGGFNEEVLIDRMHALCDAKEQQI